jgi:hypothetical protein
MPEQPGSVALKESEVKSKVPADLWKGDEDEMPIATARPEQKCPYLAGRPPHGSYHLWPSGINVCYARGTDDKPYGQAIKETQQSQCFCGATVYERCADYQAAQSRGVPLPIFAGTGPGSERGGHAGPAHPAGRERQRVKRRRRRSAFQKWKESSAASTFVCACWILLAIVAYWLVARSM